MFFFWGSALQVFGQCVGLQYGLGKANFFLGERIFRFASTDFPPAEEVWGGMRAGFQIRFFGKFSANQTIKDKSPFIITGFIPKISCLYESSDDTGLKM